MNFNKEKTLDERLEYLTKQFELLLAKEIERNKELQTDRDKQEKLRDADIKQRQAEYKQRQAEYKQRQAEFEQQKQKDAERDVKSAAEWKEVKLSFKKLNKIIGDYGLASGREAEFNFKLALKRNHLLCGGIQFDTLDSNVKKTKKSREYDIVLVNGSYVALIEVKRTVSIDDINTLILEQALSFRSDFPEYNDKKLICFIATYVAIDTVVEKARNVGIGLILKNGFKLKEITPILKEF